MIYDILAWIIIVAFWFFGLPGFISGGGVDYVDAFKGWAALTMFVSAIILIGYAVVWACMHIHGASA